MTEPIGSTSYTVKAVHLPTRKKVSRTISVNEYEPTLNPRPFREINKIIIKKEDKE